MCAKLKLFWFFLLWLCLAAGVLRAEEQGPWYLISETELRNIEQYRETSEAEKRSWLSQAQGLRTRAERLESESGSLNRQLAAARELQMKSEQSYNALEAGWSSQLSLKDGEIAALKLEKEKYKGLSRTRLVIIIVLAGLWVVFIGVMAYLKFRPFPI